MAPLAEGADEDELALLRLAASAELVTTAFHYRAKSAPALSAQEHRAFQKALFADQRHHSALVHVIGADAPVREDFDISFRRGTFGSRRRIAEIGSRLERIVLGIHLNATWAVKAPELRLLSARLAADEGGHLALLSAVGGGDLVGPPMPDAVDVEQASQVLAPYWGTG
jgi:hypothetical protein